MRRFPVRWHVLACLSFLAYCLVEYLVFTSRQGARLRQGFWLTASFTVVRIVVFYCCYVFVYPRFLRAGRLPQLVGGLAGAALLFVGLRAGIEEVLYPAWLGFHNYTPDTTIRYYIYDNLFYSLPTLGLSGALWASGNSLRQERDNQQLREEKRAAEATFLKTQINPHFLYNTLNLLYGMAYPVSKPLASALLKLAELMRYMLHDGTDRLDQVELTQEIEYLHNYLALYHLRFPNQLCVDFTVTGEPAGRRIAPLLLIPFVENAFKHGILDDPATPVRIHLRVEPREVVFKVDNRIHDQQNDATSGIGLPNLRRRLALRYPGQHQLHVAVDQDQFATLLRIAC